MDFQGLRCYIEKEENPCLPAATRCPCHLHRKRHPGMAARNNVTASVSENDLFAHHVTRLSGDEILLDDVEQMVIALQRAGLLSRVQAVRLQARYLRETKP